MNLVYHAYSLIFYTIMAIGWWNTAYASELMQPLIKDGQYYYDEHDNHEHINLKKALLLLGEKLISPTAWYTQATNLL
jgi:hypothetical protein